MSRHPPAQVPGTAVFLTWEALLAPATNHGTLARLSLAGPAAMAISLCPLSCAVVSAPRECRPATAC